jgi:N-methylhydantoinase A
VAWLSPEGTLKVGPRSAGADPGPLCYRKGGTEPTVTDAHLVLGRIPPRLLGGEVPLDTDAAAQGLQALGAKLGLELAAAAAGVLEISAWNQANALRQVTVRRGLDVRDFTLVTFGGSGSLLLCRLLELLGLRVAVVPRDPGNLSAFGLLTVDVKNDYVQTAVARHARLDLAAVASTLQELQARAAATLDAEGFARQAHRYLRSADLRYYGQAFEVRVPVPDGRVDPAMADATVAAFHDAHERLYGYCFRDRPEQQVEWVNLRVTGVGPIRRPHLREAAPGDGDAARARTGSRPVCFDAARSHLDTPVYARARLRPGDTVAGPAVVEEYGATVPLHPGFRAEVDRHGNLVVTHS